MALNEAFFYWIRTKRPFVVLKLAETLDGKIATAGGSSQWITGAAARKHVMKLRLQSDAVMVGGETYRLDNPSLTVRNGAGKVLKTPRRIVASRSLQAEELPAGWELADVTSAEKWDSFLTRLGSEQVTMLLLEGGGELAASALSAGAVNKLEMHIAPKILGGRNSRSSVGGLDPERISDGYVLRDMSWRKAGEDWIVTCYPERN
jgi:diaminohydroxyphosphoribosylaminopyrimidine deaminase/5-amino-6-(5-phosphoribosylamino)uracil reductase